VALPLPRVADGAVTLQIKQGGVVADALSTTLAQSARLAGVARADSADHGPAHAAHAAAGRARRVAFAAPGAGAFNRIVDDLVGTHGAASSRRRADSSR